MQREISLQLCDEFVENSDRKQADCAIGYLTTWAITSPRCAVVRIYGDKEGNLIANYLREGNPDSLTFSIFALRGKDRTYSFHS